MEEQSSHLQTIETLGVSAGHLIGSQLSLVAENCQ